MSISDKQDELTGLYDGDYLDKSLERELCRVKLSSQSLSVIMFDIDRFKCLNDTFNHQAGDAVLRELGNYLQANIGGEDIAYRFGGEEFVVVLIGASLDDTLKRAEQIREEIKTLRVHYEEQPLPGISASVGVACFPQHGDTMIELIKAADRALYQAKQEGRDRVVLATV